jgi:hypothetical protein
MPINLSQTKISQRPKTMTTRRYVKLSTADSVWCGCRTLALAHAAFEVAVEEKPIGPLMIQSRTRVVKRHPEGDW